MASKRRVMHVVQPVQLRRRSAARSISLTITAPETPVSSTPTSEAPEKISRRQIARLPVARPDGRAPRRGLYIAPWYGPDNELVLLAITSWGQLAAAPLTIPWGADSVSLATALEETLEQLDPAPAPAAAQQPAKLQLVK